MFTATKKALILMICLFLMIKIYVCLKDITFFLIVRATALTLGTLLLHHILRYTQTQLKVFEYENIKKA